jgi:cell division protein FtsN
LALLLAFYGLGLMLGQTDVERSMLATPSSAPSGRLKAGARDPRSELDFINAVPSKDEVARGVVEKPSFAGEIFSVEVAAFDRKQEARRVLEALVRRGFDARIAAPSDDINDSQFLVLVGRYGERTEAEAAVRRLTESGLTGVIRPAGDTAR